MGTKQHHIAPLVHFRIIFGLLLFVSAIRFWWNGWIEEQVIQPDFHFKYFGFEWIQEPSESMVYLLFFAFTGAALCVALGLFYRMATVVLFLSFSYLELIDITYYLNHYYLVTILCFLLIWMPAHRNFSLDVKWRKVQPLRYISSWPINLLRFQLGVVYFFAGLAKLHPDWLLHAEPMDTWLNAKTNLPIIGPYMSYSSTAFFFSWAGALYDLFIVFFLLWKRTRTWAYFAVLVFHGLTALLFPQIGIFPYMMMGMTLIFFSDEAHARFGHFWDSSSSTQQVNVPSTWTKALLGTFVVVQLALPFRYLCYPGELFWTEEGYRFSWRVMLMEKAGHATFYVHEGNSGRKLEVDNKEHLNDVQEIMMSTQPDLLIQYAHYLKTYYADQGIQQPKVTADVFVTLNGRGSKRFIDNTVNLAELRDGFNHKNWILPLER